MKEHLVKGWRIAFFGCAMVVLVLALMPIEQLPPSTGWDKSDHLLAFSVMGLLGLRAYPGSPLLCMAALLAYGMAIEALQALVPYRSAEWLDVLADALGVLLAIGIARLFERSARVVATVNDKTRPV